MPQTKKDKRPECKSADRKRSIQTKKNQINLMLYKNSQLEGRVPQCSLNNNNEQLKKTFNFERLNVKSSLGSFTFEQNKDSSTLLMGSKLISHLFQEQQELVREKPCKNQYIMHHVIGKGGFGKVLKVEDKKTGQFFAMKQMAKAVILTKKSVESVRNERQLLKELNNKFIVNMRLAFQDRQTLYLIMDLMPGGDLRYHICKKHKFTQQESRFFTACIFVGLQYLHSKKIIHRDIKPQNLVLDQKGYIHLTDLGIAKEMQPNNSCDTSGTPGYMAPEVMMRQNHSFEVDYYALGVILYQLVMGKRPYVGKNRKEIKDQIIAKQTIIRKYEIPQGWSIEAADFINRLLQRRAMTRLGWGGPEQVKQHAWLKNFPWKKLEDQELESPFKSYSHFSAADVRFQPTRQDEDMSLLIKENKILLRKSSVQQLFGGYTFYDQQKQSQRHTTSSQLIKKKKQ